MNRHQRRQKQRLDREPPDTAKPDPVPAPPQTVQRTDPGSLASSPTERRKIHLLGVAHTIPNGDYTVCAFTAKIIRFAHILQPYGWRVVEYSNEGSISAAWQHVVILPTERFRALSLRMSRDEPHDADVNNAALQTAFQQVLIEQVAARALPGDIVCHVFGPNMEVYTRLPHCHHVEMSVGYTASPGLPFRIYESSAWMHWHHGKAGREDGSHYQWVIPSGFNPVDWPCCEEPGDYALFLGRVTVRKGMNELVEIARRTPDLPIRAYGPGDDTQWARQAPPNLTFHGPVFGAERVDVVRRARCMLMPTVFIEPFGFSGIEAQLCGVPLVASSYGAFQETIVEGVTGYRCHTLADWAEAIALSAALDRRRISEVARSRYSEEVVGRQYDWAFRQLADLSGKGWYGEVSRKFGHPSAADASRTAKRRHIWLYMPYFGALPNYFQLYLDSLAGNADHLSVILMTDIDVSPYRLPDNLVVVPKTFQALRVDIIRFLSRNLDVCDLPADFLSTYYKLCDFKIFYPELFYDVGADLGISRDDFVGWGDCDLIYGRFADFLDETDDVHLIGGYHGHLTAIRNTSPMRRLFSEVPDLLAHLTHPDYRIVDEKAFRDPLFGYLSRNNLKVFDIHRYFCDIVPACFFGLFRPDHAARAKNFFDAYHPGKDLSYVHYDKDGRLTVVYDDGSARASIYCHLQKRRMALGFEDHEGGYFIREHGFELTLDHAEARDEAPAV